MTKNIQHTYVVEGRGQFPLDMLRRDGADYATIGDTSAAHADRGLRRVKLVTTYDRPRHWQPLDARWRSFRWRVVEHNGFDVADVPAAPSAPTQDSPEYAEAYGAMLALLKRLDANLRRGVLVTERDVEDIRAAIAEAEGRA